MWKALSNKDQEVWSKKAIQDRERFNTEMKAEMKANNGKKLLTKKEQQLKMQDKPAPVSQKKRRMEEATNEEAKKNITEFTSKIGREWN